MDKQPHLAGKSGSNPGSLAGAISIPAILGTEQEYSHQLVHRDAANAATTHMTLNAHL
jgi:hypothetical protein